MKHLLCQLVSLFLFLMLSEAAVAEEKRQLTMMTSISIAPYVIKDTQRGIALDIISESLQLKGYSILFVFVSNKRAQAELIAKRIDAAFNVPADLPKNIHCSDAVVNFQNVAISLKDRGFTINSVTDLKGKELIAFQDASNFLGKEFSKVIENNPKYNETINQESQVYHLLKDRADVIILEKQIFLYFLNKIRIKNPTSIEYVIHPIFDVTSRSACFIDEKIRNDFNDGLKKLRETGRYDKIIAEYIKANPEKK